MIDEKKILVVDDEKNIVDVVKSYLENGGYKVYPAYNGRQAFDVLDTVSPSLVVLDLMLPDTTGEEICTAIRKKSRIPIIMLTAKAKEEEIIEGLKIGADDYVTKPFSPRQLVARVAALLRRTGEANAPLASLMSFNGNDLVIDDLKREVRKNEKPISLTPSEYKLLMTLVSNPNKVFTRKELVSTVLGDNFSGYERIIDTHIKNIRQKIETNPKNPQYILTVHGVGYRFSGETETPN